MRRSARHQFGSRSGGRARRRRSEVRQGGEEGARGCAEGRATKLVVLFPARQRRAGRCRIRVLWANDAAYAATRAMHHRCVGCETQGRPGGRDSLSSSIKVREIDAGETGRSKPPRRVSGGRCAGSRRQSCAARCRRRRRWCPHRCGHDCPARCGAMCAERSAGARARGETPVRRVVHRAVREPVDGEAGTGGARSAATPSRGAARSRRSRPGRARRAPRRARRVAPSRGGRGGPADDAVERSTERVVPATAVSAASRRASGARSERSERRREGYPPEGPRPRSGLGRVARSRSDAPRLTVAFGTPFAIFGTIGITTGSVVGNGCKDTIIIGSTIIGTGVRTIFGIVGGTGCTLPFRRAT